jgi:hypothetical protein
MPDQQHPRRRSSDYNTPKQPWHLDKSIPLGLIFAILVQTTGMVWWAASLTERVGSLENAAMDNRTTAPRLAVVESKLSDIKDVLSRIETRLSGRLP